MKALVVDRSMPHGVNFVENYPDPKPTSGEVLVKVSLAGVCSTDLEIVHGYGGFEGVLGHEFVGIVTSDGPLAGKRVVSEISCCGPEYVALNHEMRKHAPDHAVLGIDRRDGVFAEYVVVPTENCHIIPDDVPDKQAVFVEPLAAACQVMEDHAPRHKDRVIVLGAGRLGLLCAQVLEAHGCNLTVVDRNPDALELCRRLGPNAVTLPELDLVPKFDMAVECTGSPAGLQLAMRIVRPRGVIVLKSTYAGVLNIDISPVVVNEITVAGNRCGPFAEAIRLLLDQRVRVEELISQIYPLSRGPEAFAAAEDPRNIKILLEPGAA